MIERDSNTVRAIAWSEVFPWLSIVRVFRIAIAARVLVLGAAGILLMATGWWLVAGIFSTPSEPTAWLNDYLRCPWLAVTEEMPNRPILSDTSRHQSSQYRYYRSTGPHWRPCDPVTSPWLLLTSPAREGLTYTGFSVQAVACLLLCGLWGVAVWAFFGAAICRIAAVQLAADEQVGLGAALRYACVKWPAYCAAPLLPVGGVLLATIPVAILGLIMNANVGLLLGGLVWPLALVAGLLMTLLLLGVLFGWPLMWAAISAEGTDSFDALSRSYAYLFQRPLHYLFYSAVAGLIGWLGWLLVQNFAAGVIWMGYWAAAWGCGTGQIDSIMGVGEELGGISYAGAVLIRFWTGCVKLLAVGYLFSYFWTAATAIYFLLRRDVDATEMDEVFLDADKSEETFGLPAIATDQAGAPVAEDDAGKPNSAE
jgi:hypothetical protein